MALKDTWIDKKDGDDILPSDINDVARSAIKNEGDLAKANENAEKSAEETAKRFKDINEKFKDYYTAKDIDNMVLREVDLTKVTTLTEGEADITENTIDPTTWEYAWAKGVINVSGYCEIEVENTGIDVAILIINGERYTVDKLSDTTISYKGYVKEPITFEIEQLAVAKFTRFVATSEHILRNEIKRAVDESGHTTKEELDTRTLSDLDLTTEGVVTWNYDNYDISVGKN